MVFGLISICQERKLRFEIGARNPYDATRVSRQKHIETLTSTARFIII